MARCMQARKTAGVGAMTLFEPEGKFAAQSVFYALRTRVGACASGCGVSQSRVAEMVFGGEIVEWYLCFAYFVFSGFLDYLNSRPSATLRYYEHITHLLVVSYD